MPRTEASAPPAPRRLRVGIVHAGADIRFVAVARTRHGLHARLGEHVREWCRYQLPPEEAEAVERSLEAGDARDAVRRYFARPGRWEPETLVVERVELDV